MHNKEDKILNSLTGLHKATAPDFFYTRLLGRMQKDIMPERKQFFLLKPAFLGAVLFLALVINVFSIMRFSDKLQQPKTTVRSSQPGSIESFADAYHLNTETVYE